MQPNLTLLFPTSCKFMSVIFMILDLLMNDSTAVLTIVKKVVDDCKKWCATKEHEEVPDVKK